MRKLFENVYQAFWGDSKAIKITIGVVIVVFSVLFAVVLKEPIEKKTQEKPPSVLLKWEKVSTPPEGQDCYRTATPEGWIVFAYNTITYVPDSAHAWK